MGSKRNRILAAASGFCLFMTSADSLLAQQFSSDSWLSKDHGVVTIIPTIGQRSSMLMTTYSLFPKWEFTVAMYQYNDDGDPTTSDGYSSTLYAKYMFYQNKAATGGAAVKGGTGLFPGYLTGEERVKDAFQTYWMNAPVTIPLFNNRISWDIMPGTSVSRKFNEDNDLGWSFTYCTRVAYYVLPDKFSIVGEVFGAEGETNNIPEYKTGLRWEPSKYAVFALTYGQEFEGDNGAGFEFGIMLFTPPFACFGKCKPKE
jgi:hypothetical protein